MSQEIVYTSAPQGLKPGSRGFCTVIATQGMARNLAERLESLSGYRHAYAVHDEHAHLNPVNYSHLKFTVGGQEYSVLSRIGDAGQDYTGRTNKLAHHVALTPSERPPAGPAYQLQQPGFCIEAWDSQTRYTEINCHRLSSDHPPLTQCTSWSRWCDAGWAGVLAESALEGRNQSQTIIYPVEAGSSTLALVSEALQLLPEKQRWEVTFSTYFTKLPAGVDCQWRFVLDGSPEAEAARRNPRVKLIDLCADLGTAPEGPLVAAARTGQRPQQLKTDLPSTPVPEPPVPTPSPSASPKRTTSPPPLAQHFQKAKSNGSRKLLIGTGGVLLLLLIVGVGYLLMPDKHDQEKVAKTSPPPLEMENKKTLEKMEREKAEAVAKEMKRLSPVNKTETATIDEPPLVAARPILAEITKTADTPQKPVKPIIRDTYLVFGEHPDFYLKNNQSNTANDDETKRFPGGKLLVLPMSQVKIHLTDQLELTVHEKTEIELSMDEVNSGEKSVPRISLRFGRITVENVSQKSQEIILSEVTKSRHLHRIAMTPLGVTNNITAIFEADLPIAPLKESQLKLFARSGEIKLDSDKNPLGIEKRESESPSKIPAVDLQDSKEITAALTGEKGASPDSRSEKYYQDIKRILLEKLNQSEGQQKAQLTLALGLLGEVDPLVKALMEPKKKAEVALSWPEFVDVLHWQLVSLPESDQKAQEEKIWQAVNSQLSPGESIATISELKIEYDNQLKSYNAEKKDIPEEKQESKKEKLELPKELVDAWERLRTAEDLLDLIRGNSARLKIDTFGSGGTVRAESVLKKPTGDIYFVKILQYGDQQLKVGDYLSRALVIWNLERISGKPHTSARVSNPSHAGEPRALDHWKDEFEKHK
ncbi:hypothetical protein CA11_39990 [Gimesia maris]|uniref:GAP1-N2 domain-containing protein n=1 Tax=Gimesia maris TaxID=122 RepID=UPI00118CDBAD|nr:hypothetical protein [Gimesia maris]QDU16170.1 hypothetical protein CA11_39990 [Gimesia maris]